jgi:DNA/RNA-binding protein KIN17
MRDENGFKCHVASESHVRNMLLIGEDPRKAINDFSREFERDFLQLLRTGHGEKKINLNQFYQEYIANKQHVHMNATKWTSLTEFARYLGRAGICRVEEDEKNGERGGASGLMIGWIDNSPDALRRQEALKKKERQDKGDEEREQRMIAAQIRRARKEGTAEDDDEGDAANGNDQVDSEESGEGIKRKNGEKVILNFASKKTQPQSTNEVQPQQQPPTPPLSTSTSEKDKSASPQDPNPKETTLSPPPSASVSPIKRPSEDLPTSTAATSTSPSTSTTTASTISKPLSLSLNPSNPKPKNIFAATKKNALSPSTKKPSAFVQQKPMSEAERIMKEEIERKRIREMGSGGGVKRQRVG